MAMTDTLLVRYVDDQCAQVNWLLACEDNSALAQRSILNAACAVAERALVGYFAERTQKRYNAEVWRGFLTVGASFEALALHAQQSASVLVHWRHMEREDDSSFARVLQAIAQSKVPSPPSYKSSLLSATTLSEEALATPALVIASSNTPSIVTLASFKVDWLAVASQIQQDRQIALEC